MRIIKRYANRKLYDSEAHRYIGLPDLAVLVRKDVELRVQDHVTGQDYTAVTLALVIAEEQKHSQTVDVSVLEKVIREGIPEAAERS